MSVQPARNLSEKTGAVTLHLPKGVVTVAGVLIFSFLLMPELPSLLNIDNFSLQPRNSILLITACVAILWRAEKHLPRIQLAAGRWWLVWLIPVFFGCIVRGSLKPIPLFFLTYLLPYSLGCTLGQRTELRERIGKALGIATLIIATLAIFEFVTASYIFPVTAENLSSFSRIGLSRSRVNFGHPLALGMFLTLGLFFAVRLFESTAARLGAAGLVVIATTFTVSRSPLAGLVAAAFCYAVFIRGMRRRLLGGLAVGAMALGFLIAPGSFAQDFRVYLSQSTQQSNVASDNVIGRQRLLTAGIDTVLRSPLAGSGVGSTFRGDSTIVSSDGASYGDIANFPLDVAIETGATGLFALIMIIVTSLRRASKFDPAVRRTLVAATIGVFVSSLGVNALSVSGIALFFLGLYATQPECVEPELRPSDPVHTADTLDDRSSHVANEAAAESGLLEIYGRVRR